MTGSWFARGDDETVQWSGSPRRTPVVAVALLAVVVSAGLAVVRPLYGAAGLGVGALVVVLAYLWLTNTEYVLTDHAVYHKRGILGTHVSRVELSRVQNTDLKKGIVGTQLGFGTVQVDTAGSSGVELTIWKVDDPDSVRELLIQHRKRAGGDGLSGSNDEAIRRALAEARELRTVAESLERRFTGGGR